MADLKHFSLLHKNFFVYTNAYIVHARAVATATSSTCMLQGLFYTSETSESVALRLHSVFTAASAEGIHLDAAPDNKVSLHVEFGRRHVFFHLRSPFDSEDADPTASTSQPACSINDVLLEAASKTRLPSVPKSGSENISTALDTLTGDVFSYLAESKLRFPADLCVGGQLHGTIHCSCVVDNRWSP